MVTGFGVAVSGVVKLGAPIMETATVCVTLPPGPKHCSEYCVATTGFTVVNWLPGAFAPLHELAGKLDAVHVVALMAFQSSRTFPPLATLVGVALKDSMGGALTMVTFTEVFTCPPVPEVHDRL
jgi:hypothetical protein